MSNGKVKKESKTVELGVTANLLESKEDEKTPQGVAYAFSSGGRLLARASLDERGTATLTFPAAEEAMRVRVMVGPMLEEKEVLISDLQRRGAEDRFMRVDPQNLTPSVEITVSRDKWICWLFGLCFVQGNLQKRVVSGGVGIDLPICDAIVEIYEVDPIEFIIPRLPDLTIERIRDNIINPPPPPPPPIEEPPGPFPIERPLGLISPSSLQSGAKELEKLKISSAAKAITALPVKELKSQALSGAVDLQFLARTTNTAQFREVLIENAALIRHILCLLFPIPVTMHLVATATTDGCGHFESFFFKGCNNSDTPNLYFKAKQQVFPFPFPPITIYAPTPIACYTYWDYACGTEVTLYSSNPLAITCGAPCPPVIAPENWVLIMAVGNFPLSRIYGTSETLQATTNSTNLGLTDDGAPWGGLLRPRIEFDNSLRDSLGIKYYQVSWRKGTSGPFQPLIGDVHRHYTHKIGNDLVLEEYRLGPNVVNGVPNLFEIPPDLPPIGQWSIPDAVEDTTSAKFPTNDFVPATPVDQSGLYQLKLDLFDSNGAPVDIAAKGINYRVPTSTDLSGTIETEDAAILGLVSGNSFIMTLHIDNNVCSSSLADPKLNGSTSDPNCGVLRYNPTSSGSVELDYTAFHPHGFATYIFGLYRGGTKLTPPSTSQLPVGTGSFSITQAVSYLLGGCSLAGFAEYVNVYATAIDGWRRLYEYDTPTIARGFVLAPSLLP